MVGFDENYAALNNKWNFSRFNLRFNQAHTT